MKFVTTFFENRADSRAVISRAGLLIILSMTAMLGLLACQNGENIRGTQLPEMPFVDFTLDDQFGRPFTLSEQRGKVILMFFGFTYCPDVCPLTLSTWKKVESMLSNKADDMRFIYITVDPERDTAPQLQEHLSNFSDSFLGLRGSQEALLDVYKGFGVYREKVDIAESAAGYLVNHTASIFLLDKSGVWKIKHSNDANPEDIAHDIRILLARKNEETTQDEGAE